MPKRKVPDRLLLALACVLASSGVAWQAPAAVADHPASGAPDSSQHAARDAHLERLKQRDLARLARLSPAERRRVQARERREQQAYAAQSERLGAPEQVGRWTVEPFHIPAFAIHTAVLPTGKVLFYSYPAKNPDYSRPNEGRAFIWDPSKGTGSDAFKDVAPPRMDIDGDGDTEPANLFCSAQSFLADGRLLVTGGNRAYKSDGAYTTDSGGLNTVFVFDPQTEQWSRQPDMEQGRWYPSQVLMPDGRTTILGGYTGDPPGGVFNTDLEVYTPAAAPAAGTIAHLGDRQVENYPHLKVLPDGNVLLAGPGVSDSAILDPANFTWSNLPQHDRFRQGSTTVFRAPTPGGSTTVTQLGGFDPNTASGALNASDAFNSTETMNVSDPAPQWTPDASLNVGRSYANTVALPDGTLLEVGGANGYDDVADFWRVDPAARQVELLEPGASAWKLGPASVEDRGYHSTAVLLPDGRVWTAGDDRWPGADWSTTDTAEIYSPPYLYRGARPELSSVPETLRWDDEFGVQTSGASRAVLVAPAATTHGNDMNQRLVPLELTGTVAGKGLNLRAPANANLALPGYYMLFTLSPEGVPSVARWVQLRADAPDRPTVGPDPLSAGAGSGPGAQPPVPAVGPGKGQSPADGLKKCPRRIALAKNGTVRLCEATNPPTASTSQTLTGTLPSRRATGARKRRRKRTTKVMGSGRNAIPAGQTRPVTARLTAKASRTLRRTRALRLRVAIEARGSDGQTATVRRTIVVTFAKKRGKKRSA